MLDESDVGAFLAETLAAYVETVFSDQTGGVCADSAVEILLALLYWMCLDLGFLRSAF
jgi:spore maturation protein SpmA